MGEPELDGSRLRRNGRYFPTRDPAPAVSAYQEVEVKV